MRSNLRRDVSNDVAGHTK